jgi:hypothetical protein
MMCLENSLSFGGGAEKLQRMTFSGIKKGLP